MYVLLLLLLYNKEILNAFAFLKTYRSFHKDNLLKIKVLTVKNTFLMKHNPPHSTTLLQWCQFNNNLFKDSVVVSFSNVD